MKSAMIRVLVGLCLCLTSVASAYGQSNDVKAGSWVETYRHTCGDVVQTLKVTCSADGEQVWLRTGCGGRFALVKYECRRPEPTAPVVADTAETTSTDSRFDWSLGVLGGGLWSPSGMSAYFVEAQGAINLRMAEKWWWSLQLGPGYGNFGGAHLASLSEYTGPQWRATQWLRLGFGARHRVMLDGTDDRMQFLGGELQAGLAFGSFEFGLAVDLGWARHVGEAPAEGLYPVGEIRPMVQIQEDTFAGGVSGTLKVLF